jgi:K+-sensing histidine kinase KdpD
MLDVECEQLHGEVFGNYVMPEFQDMYFLSWRSALSMEQAQSHKLALRRSDGTSFHALLNIHMPNKEDRQIYMSILDISMLNDSEASLSHALHKEEALKQEREKVFSALSHEFRKPLTSILFSLELLYKYGNMLTSRKNGELYQSIRNLVWYLNDTLQDAASIQAFEEQTELKVESFDLMEFSQQIITDVEAIKPEGQKISLDTAVYSHNSTVVWNVNTFRRILMNILRYSFGYASKTVYCRIELRESIIRLEVEQQEAALSRDGLLLRFQEFCTGKDSEFVRGRGNGLFIVYNTVRAYGGTMDCDSRAGGRLSYVIELPRYLNAPVHYQQ